MDPQREAADDLHVSGRRAHRDSDRMPPGTEHPEPGAKPAGRADTKPPRPSLHAEQDRPARAGSTRPVRIEPASRARRRGRTRVATSPDCPPTVLAWKTPGLRPRRSKAKPPSVPAVVCAITVQPLGSRWTRNTSESGTVAPENRTNPSYATTEGCAESVTPSAPQAGAARAKAVRAASGTTRRIEAHCAVGRTIPPWQPPRKGARPTPGSRSSRSTPRTTSRVSSSSFPASTRSRAGRTRTCTAAGRGRSGSTPASPRPRRRTSGSATCSSADRPASRSPSTCRRSSGTTPTTRARRARWGGPASRSTRSPTWSCSSTASR